MIQVPPETYLQTGNINNVITPKLFRMLFIADLLLVFDVIIRQVAFVTLSVFGYIFGTLVQNVIMFV